MNLSKKAWYMRVYYAFAWLQKRALFRSGPIKDPVDLCPFIRMFVWGPLSALLLMSYAASAVGVVVFLGHAVGDWGDGLGSSARSFLWGMLLFFLALVVVIGVTATVGVAIVFLVGGVLWLGEQAIVAISNTPPVRMLARAIPQKKTRDQQDPRPVLRLKKYKPERGPTFLDVFFEWLDGKLHRFCARITVVE